MESEPLELEETTNLIERLPALEREAEELESKARGLRQVIEGIRILNGDVAGARFVEQSGKVYPIRPRDPGAPRGREAIRRLMSEEPDRVWKVVELKREVLLRGWAPSPKAVEGTVRRMDRLGELERSSYGHYRMRQD